jgi:hypothetical protein
MYGTDHDVPYLYIRNSALQDRGEQRPLRASPIGQGRRRGDAPTNSGPDNYCCLSYWCTRPQEVARHTEAERSGEGLGHRGGAERRAGALLARGLRPMIVAGEPSTGPFIDRDIGSARPTGDSYGRTTRGPAQRRGGRKAKAALSNRCGVEQRGKLHTHYKGRDALKHNSALAILVAARLIGVGLCRNSRKSGP